MATVVVAAGARGRSSAPARTGAPGVAGSSARANSAAVANRSAGALASARATACATASGTVSRTSCSGRGVSVIRRAIIACAVGAENGVSPASISYSTVPRL